MKKVQRSLMFALVAMVMAAPMAMANPMQGNRGPGPGGPEGGPEMMAGGPGLVSQLNLTADQIKILKKQKLKKRKAMIQLRADMELLQIDLAEAANQDNPDKGKIERMAKKAGTLHGEMIAERMSSIVFLRSILTDEQKQVMDTQHLLKGQGGQKANQGKKGKGGKKSHGRRR